MLTVFGFAVIGIYGIAAALQGCMENPIGIAFRLLSLIGGIACMWPNNIYIQIMGVITIAILLVLNLRTHPVSVVKQ